MFFCFFLTLWSWPFPLMIFTSHYMLLHTQPTHRKLVWLTAHCLILFFSGDFYLCPAKFIAALLLGKCHHTWIWKIYLGGLFEGEQPWISGSVLFILCLWGHLEPGLLLETPKTNSLFNLWNYLFIYYIYLLLNIWPLFRLYMFGFFTFLKTSMGPVRAAVFWLALLFAVTWFDPCANSRLSNSLYSSLLSTWNYFDLIRLFDIQPLQ